MSVFQTELGVADLKIDEDGRFVFLAQWRVNDIRLVIDLPYE